MQEYEHAISLRGVVKRYDNFTLDHISFDVPKGSIMGFIGQNGAGKTTTIRSLLNIIGIDEGEIRLLGMDHIKEEQEIKQRIAVVFDELPFMTCSMQGIWPGFFRGCIRNGAIRFTPGTWTGFSFLSRKKAGSIPRG